MLHPLKSELNFPYGPKDARSVTEVTTCMVRSCANTLSTRSIKNCPMAETFHVDSAQEPLDGSSPRAFRWAGYPSWTVQLGGRCSITALNEWTCLFVHRLPLVLVSPPLVLHN